MRFIKLIILLCFCANLYAQQDSITFSPEIFHIEKQYHPFYLSNSLYLSESELPKGYAQVNINTFTKDNNFKNPFLPKSSKGINLYSEGFKNIKGYNLYGSVIYNENYQDGLIGKNTIDSKYLNPFFIADTLQKDWKNQSVKVFAKMSKSLNKDKLNLSLGVAYQAAHSVNYQFPKPIIYKNAISITPSIGFKVFPESKLEIGYNYKNSTEELNIDDGTVTNVKLFAVTGVGSLENNNGFASNYRIQQANSHTASITGNFKLNPSLNILYTASLENYNLIAFDDFLKTKETFNYKEWLTNVLVQLRYKTNTATLALKYSLQYQDGLGDYKQSNISTTYKEQFYQKINLGWFNYNNKQNVSVTLKHWHNKEQNTQYGNYFDYDYLGYQANYTKMFPLKNSNLIVQIGAIYLQSVYNKKRFVRDNHYINNVLLPYIDFNNQNYFSVHINPSLSFKAFKKSYVEVSLKNSFAFNECKVNFYNNLGVNLWF